ncbi:LysR family transcriptional regulator [Burkholderia plantarii]|uniref:LysR family transcriptional regulator n=1 Tax=Burkholderia plantarii TaxID=41899 RepID=UPI0006D88CF1|nr:LysR family transcriptional regulator [Burkholderia plantarii]ALK34984.1 LysR family transcriptional regulator [Burkholderia plantarii]WLE61258.1 LysR family transcriptional regulator [Burkholderia plantarii]GLZ19065.1 transcriptional regulator [Burkholderia plantarii]
MNLKFLETFIWVAKLRSFSLAAEKLHSTQAAISSRISVLEQELGARLFKREPKGVTLTREGERVLRHAEQVSRSMTQLYESLQGETFAYGTIRIGAMDSAIHSWFVDFVTDVMEHYPNLDIEVTSDTALNLNEQLRRGMLDMVIQTDMLRDESIRSIGVLELAVVWIAAAGSPVSGRLPEDTATAALRRLGSERLITYSRHSRPHQDVLRLMQSYGINEARVSCVNSLAAMIRLTQAGFGVAALPPALVQDLLEKGTLRRLEGLEVPPPLPFTIAWRTGSEWTERLVEIAVETVRGYAARLGEGAARVIV